MRSLVEKLVPKLNTEKNIMIDRRLAAGLWKINVTLEKSAEGGKQKCATCWMRHEFITSKLFKFKT